MCIRDSHNPLLSGGETVVVVTCVCHWISSPLNRSLSPSASAGVSARGDGGRQRVVADGERLSLAQQGGALERDLLHGAGYRSGRLLMRERTPVSLPSHAAAGWVLL